MDKDQIARDETTILAGQLLRRAEDWQMIAGFIKDRINDFDHTKDDPINELNWIDRFLDRAFGDMDSAIRISKGLDQDKPEA